MVISLATTKNPELSNFEVVERCIFSLQSLERSYYTLIKNSIFYHTA